MESKQHPLKENEDRKLYFLQTERMADCDFLVGESAPNQKKIAAHRLILAMASPVFEKLFDGQLPVPNDPILIPDIEPDAFQSMLVHIYSDKLYITSVDLAYQLYYAAKKYMLSQLLKKCTLYLNSNLNTGNVCQIYEFAEFYDEHDLKQKSLQMIIRHTGAVLTHPSFIEIKISTLMVILAQNKLCINSEIDLFNAVSRLANHKKLLRDTSMQNAKESNMNYSTVSTNEGLVAGGMEKNGEVLEAPYTNTNQLDNEEYLLKEALKKIRFLTMTSQQFCEGPARSTVLEKHEALDILVKICNPSSPLFKLPAGFCNSETSRCGGSRFQYHYNRDYEEEEGF